MTFTSKPPDVVYFTPNNPITLSWIFKLDSDRYLLKLNKFIDNNWKVIHRRINWVQLNIRSRGYARLDFSSPATYSFTFTIPSDEGKYQLQVFDEEGRELLQGQMLLHIYEGNYAKTVPRHPSQLPCFLDCRLIY